MYKDLTLEMITDIVTKHSESKRELFIYTGSGGKRMIDIAIQKEVYIMDVEYMKKSRMITEKESDNLMAMINSVDEENYEVAKVIINNKKL